MPFACIRDLAARGAANLVAGHGSSNGPTTPWNVGIGTVEMA